MDIEMEKEKNIIENGNLKFEGEYKNDLKWNGKGSNNLVYELKNGKGLIKEYWFSDKLSFEGEYLMGK